MLTVGDKVPLDIKLMNNDGKEVTLLDYLDKYLILYFYPEDDTPTCTEQACSFRDLKTELIKLNVNLVGISSDSVVKHQKFITKYQLNFPLLADTDLLLHNAFGTWGEKKMFGRKYMGTFRRTFAIRPDGTIVKVWDNIEVKKHDQEVLKFLVEDLN